MKTVLAGLSLLKAAVSAFLDDSALSRGAAIAFYTVTSFAPILLIVIAIAGLVFGQEAAQHAIIGQLSSLMGRQTGDLLQGAIASAAGRLSGIIATIIGVGTLLATASGVFGEIQAALNAIWRVKPKGTTVSRLLRARAASLGLVAALGFLLIVSLVVSAGLSAFGEALNSVLPFGRAVFIVINILVSIALLSGLFAAIYKILPDRHLNWGDVIVGAVATAILFTIGKSLIGWYIGASAIGSAYGAAGSLMVLLIWVYYSAQIFLLGAEFTKVYANRHGSRRANPVGEIQMPPAGLGPNEARTAGMEPNFSTVVPSRSVDACRGEMQMPMQADPSVDQLQRESEKTRAELSSTVQELGEQVSETISDIKTRVTPSHIKTEVKDYVRDGFELLKQQARENPLQAIAIGAGIAYPALGLIRRIPAPLLLLGTGYWLSKNSVSSIPGVQIAYRKGSDVADNVVGRVSDIAHAAHEAVTENVRKVSNSVSDVAATVSDAAQGMTKNVSQAVADLSQAGQRSLPEEPSALIDSTLQAAGSVADSAASIGRQTGTRLAKFLEDNPLLVAGATLAVGAFIAASLPASKVENRFFGQGNERIRRGVRNTVADGVERVKEAASEVGHEVSRAASERGLDNRGVAQAVHGLADRVTAVVDRAVDTVLDGAGASHSDQPNGRSSS